MSDGQGDVQRQIDADRERVDARNARLPQRFKWKDEHGQPWRYGCVFPVAILATEWWSIRAGNGHGSFDDDPWETMGHVIGDVAAFEWIDNDYGWHPP